jgi:hypothetical protein
MSSIALHGNLRDFGIAEVFQLIGQQRKTGTLQVEGAEGSIFLAFDGGRVVRGGPLDARGEREPLGPQLVRAGYLTREQLDNLKSESERSARPIPVLLLAAGLIEEDTLSEVQHLLTRETVFDVMRRKNGDFHFTAEPVVHDTPAERLLGAEQILMDGLRMLDEWRTFVDVVPSQDAVFRRVGDLESVRALTKGEPDARLGHAERILQLIDGRLSVRRIIDLSRIGTFEATRALAELRQAGVIDLVSQDPARVADTPSSRRRPPLVQLLRAAIATTVPIALLGVLGSVLLERVDATGGLPGSAIPLSTLHQLGNRYETRLVRELLEAHYFETGGYPTSLVEIVPQLEDSGLSLTPSQLADYYYAVRDGEVVLLPPMH